MDRERPAPEAKGLLDKVEQIRRKDKKPNKKDGDLDLDDVWG